MNNAKSLVHSKWRCFYINLERHRDRSERLRHLLEKVPCLFHRLHRISAVDGQQLNSDDIEALEREGVLRPGSASTSPNNVSTQDLNGHLTLDAIGCALSHRNAWMQLLENCEKDEIDWALVLQDNVSSLADDFATRFESLLHQLPCDFDLCYIGYHDALASSAPLQIHRCNSFSDQKIYGMFGYLISKDGAHKLLGGSPRVRSPFPLACRLDSAMSQILGSLRAYRIGHYAALLCGSSQREALTTQVRGNDSNGFSQTVWKPGNNSEHQQFLSLLRRLAEAPRCPTLQAPSKREPIMLPDEVKDLKAQLQLYQEQLAQVRKELLESQAYCQKLEAENSSLKKAPERLLTPIDVPKDAPQSFDGIGIRHQPSTKERSHLESRSVESFVDSSPSKPATKPKVDVMTEVARICVARTPAEVLGIAADADDASMQKAWKKLVFALHPDKLTSYSEEHKKQAADALQSVHVAKEEFRESSQASGLVDVPEILVSSRRPVCTRNVPGQRRFECSWDVPEKHDPSRPIEKYEVYGPRIFAHNGEPMEWVLLATLPKIEGCFIFVEESPTQQEVMWAGDKIRSPSIPLTVYAINGRGRSEPLYIHLPWQTKFPWLQGRNSLICRQCCCVQPRPLGRSDKLQCASCDNTISLNTAAIVVNCPECHGEAMWDDLGVRLDCRCCGRCLAKVAQRQPLKGAAARGVSTPPLVASQWKNGHGNTGARQSNASNGGGYHGHGRWA